MGVYRALKEHYGTLHFPDGIYGTSVGCLFALAAAYDLPVETVERMYETYFKLDSFIEDTTIDSVRSLLEKGGLMTMDRFSTTLVETFLLAGIDLRDKRIDDIPQKVYFVASNITSQRPSLLTGEVPIIKAMACSACLPFLFVPQVLNGQLYVDGGIYTKCIRSVVPPSTLVVQISSRQLPPITQTNVIQGIVARMMLGPIDQYYGDNVLYIRHEGTSIIDDVTKEQRERLSEDGYLQTRAFLAKRLAEKVE